MYLRKVYVTGVVNVAKQGGTVGSWLSGDGGGSCVPVIISFVFIAAAIVGGIGRALS